MKPSTATVGLGLLALLTGVLGLRAVFASESPVIPIQAQPLASSKEDAEASLQGVDDAITRVLVELGLADVRAGSDLADVPAEVVRVLSTMRVGLTSADGTVSP